MIKDFERMVMGKIPEEYMSIVSGCLIIAADKYEVQDRCTDIVVADTSNEGIVKMYIASCAVEGKRKKTLTRYYDEITKFLITIGKNIEDITALDIRKYFAVMMTRGVKNTTINGTKNVLSPFFKWLVAEELIDKNPMAKIKSIKHNDVKEKPFSDSETSRLKDAASDPMERALVEFLLSTGVRVSEVANMKIEDVNFKNNEVYVHDGKGGKDRTAYITNVALMYLQIYLNSRKDDSPYLFVSRKNPQYSVRGIQSRIRTIGDRAGVDNVHPHRFRHTLASNLAKAGMSIQAIQIILGHSNIETTMRYVTTETEQVRNRYLQTA